MKHSVKMLLCLVLCLCTLACFAACKKKNAPTAPATSTVLPTDTASIYYLTGVKYGDEKVWTLEQLDIVDPEQCYIYFALDGTGEMHIELYDSYFQYADGQLWDDLDPDTKVNYIIEGDALTLEQDGYQLVFTRGELPEWAQPQEEDEIIEDVIPEESDDGAEAPQG